MKIKRDEILRLSRLSGISFDENEIAEITAYLENFLEQMNSFIEMDTSCFENVADEPHDALREDRIVNSFSREEILLNAPCRDGEMFIVPRVVD